MGTQQNEVGEALTARLTRLHQAYVSKVNSMLQAGQDVQATELAKAYTDEALSLIVAEDPTR